MADIEHWDAGVCPACGTLYAEIFTLCECELPTNTEGVEVERVRLVPATQLRRAVEGLERERARADEAVADLRLLIVQQAAEIERLQELAAAATRAHTRAIHALAGNLDYPKQERAATGRYLSRELQRRAR